MKKWVLLFLSMVFMLGNVAFAEDTKAIVDKVSENTINISVNSPEKIKITGYTINKGSSILVYYINSANGSNSDSIIVDTNTVARPYRVILVNGSQSPSIQPFADINNHQMKDYIRHLHDVGFVEGYEEDNTFKPDDNITRAEFITIIIRALKFDEKPEFRKSFNDLDQNHWAYSYLIKAIDNGLVEGSEEDGKKLLKPDDDITFAEACKIIDEAFKIQNSSPANYDVRFVNHWAKSYLQILLNENVISPSDDFYQKGAIDRPAKRGEVAMLLSRTLGR